MIGTAIITKVGRNELVEILRKKKATASAILSQEDIKYTKEEKLKTQKYCFLFRKQSSCSKYLIFVVGSTIYANKIAGAVTDILMQRIFLISKIHYSSSKSHKIIY